MPPGFLIARTGWPIALGYGTALIGVWEFIIAVLPPQAAETLPPSGPVGTALFSVMLGWFAVLGAALLRGFRSKGVG